jgi:hypothetical protein
MEYCPGGNLTLLLDRHMIDPPAAALIVAQAALAIDAVHRHGYAHRYKESQRGPYTKQKRNRERKRECVCACLCVC